MELDGLVEQGKLLHAAKSPLSYIPGRNSHTILHFHYPPLFFHPSRHRYISGISGLEAKALWTRPTPYLLSLYTIEDPVIRIQTLLNHILVNLNSSIRDTFVHSKPYNPILGEVFRCTFEHEDSTTEYIAEQVSHHPPMSADLSYNIKHQFIHESCSVMKMILTGGFNCAFKMSGVNNLYLINHDEKYEMDGPGVRGFGLLFGSAGFEPAGELIIKNTKHNLRCKVKFGKKLKMEGKIQRIEGKKKTLLRSFKGTMLGKIEMTEAGESTSSVWYDVDKLNWGTAPKVRGIEEQEENESRRVWHSATHELFVNKDEDAAQKAKADIEQRQRDIAKKRKEEGVEFEQQFFKKTGEQVNGVTVFKYKNWDDLIREISEKNEEEAEDEEMD